jgi:hypothetical protein
VEGKLDSSFVTWLATTWHRQYGGTIHQKRADVLRHFKKDLANLAMPNGKAPLTLGNSTQMNTCLDMRTLLSGWVTA